MRAILPFASSVAMVVCYVWLAVSSVSAVLRCTVPFVIYYYEDWAMSFLLLWLVSCLVIISCDDGYFDLRQARWCMSGTSAFGIPASDLLGSSGAHNSLGKIDTRRPMRTTLTHCSQMHCQ